MERFDDDVEFLGDVAAQFQKDSANLLEAIQAAVAAGDASGVRSAAHSLKGAGSNFGAAALQEVGQQIEDLGVAGDIETARPLIEKLPNLVTTLNNALSDYCAAQNV